METLLEDLRYAARSLAKQPGQVVDVAQAPGLRFW